MDPLGPKLAEGRDAEIYEHGPGRVLRLARDGRSLVREAEVMGYARAAGYPVPEVHDAGDGFLVMDRVDGSTLIDDAIPLGLGRAGRVLAGLHEQLHRIPAPDWLERTAPLTGDRLVHRDLHPLNVLVTDDGPVVIDWSSACRGDPAYDVADAWLLMACADPPSGSLVRLAAPVLRRVLLRSFLGALDREAARRALPVAADARRADPNLSDAEVRRMRDLADREGR